VRAVKPEAPVAAKMSAADLFEKSVAGRGESGAELDALVTRRRGNRH
jgi:hypothetical protein